MDQQIRAAISKNNYREHFTLNVACNVAAALQFRNLLHKLVSAHFTGELARGEPFLSVPAEMFHRFSEGLSKRLLSVLVTDHSPADLLLCKAT